MSGGEGAQEGDGGDLPEIESLNKHKFMIKNEYAPDRKV
jgi:hypothetical protein